MCTTDPSPKQLRVYVDRVFRTVASIGLALAFAMGALGAQQRQPLVGRVVDKDGAPVAQAKVTLVEDDADLAGIDPVDVVEATTDDKGRFVAHALRGVRYTALAVGPEVGGKALVARPVRDLACGRVAELKVAQAGERHRGKLPGLEPWGGPAALCVRLHFADCPGYAIELPIGADAGVELPPLAVVGDAELGLRTGGGIALLDRFTAPLFALRSESVRVQVVDEKGAPVEGARIELQDNSLLWSRGEARTPPVVTDRGGRASLTYGTFRNSPFEEVPEGLLVVATKAGCAEAGSGWVCKTPFVDWSTVAAHAASTVRLVMHAERPLRAVVKGAALAGRTVRVLALGNAAVPELGTASYFVPRMYDVAVAADGSIAVPELPPGVSDVRLALPTVDGRRVVLMPSHTAELNPVDLADCDVLSLQVLDASHGPAAAAKVILVPFACDGDFEHAPPIVLDQAGRADVLLQHGRWQILAMDDSNWVWLELTEWRADAPITLQLAPMPAMRVRVVDPAGRPVAGARFEPGQFISWGHGRPGQASLLNEFGWNAFATCIRRAETDASGAAELRALPWPTITPTLFAWRGDQQHRCADAPFAPSDDVRELKLQR